MRGDLFVWLSSLSKEGHYKEDLNQLIKIKDLVGKMNKMKIKFNEYLPSNEKLDDEEIQLALY